MRNLAFLFAVFSITLFAGCRTVAVVPVGPHVVVTHSQQTYPPLDPGNGYRYHYYDHDLVYDDDFGAYVVLGYDGIYFYNNLYFRYYAGEWQSTARLNGVWNFADSGRVPHRLRNHKRYRRHSPPPHAPAHGHRLHYQNDIDMIFDSGIGAYIVLGFDNLFFFNNHYMRYYDGYWHYSDRHNGKWLRADDRHIPYSLREARKRNKRNFFKNLNTRYRDDHREYRERHKHRNEERHDRRDDRGNHHDGRNDKRDRNDRRNSKRDRNDDRYDRRNDKGSQHDGSKNKKEGRQRNDSDEDNDDNRREKKASGWLR
jgi:hypothetical protein